MLDVIYTIIYLSSVFVCLIFLYFLFRKTKKTESSKALIALISVTAIWTTLEIFAPIDLISDEFHIFLWRLTFYFSCVVTLFLLRFTLVFFGYYEKIKKVQKISLGFLYLYFFFVTIFTDNVISGLIKNKELWEIGYEKGGFFLIAILIISLPVLISLIVSSWKFFSTNSKIKKKQYLLMSIGIAFPTIMGVVTNLIFPYLGIDFPRLANLSSIVLLAFLFYIIYELGAFGEEVERYSIKLRMIFFVLTISFLSSIFGFSFFYSNSIDVLEKEIYTRLNNDLQAKTDQLENFLRDQESKLEITVHSSIIINDFFSKYNQDEEYFYLLQRIREKMALISDENFYDFFLMDNYGMVIASSNENFKEGQNNSNEDFFKKAFNKNYISDVKKENGSNDFYFDISVPFFERTNNEFRGVVSGKIKAQVVFDIFNENIELGKTGEIFLLNKDMIVMSPTRYLHLDVVTKEKIITENSKDCFSYLSSENSYLNKGTLISFLDHRGEECFGVNAFLPQREWCIVSEIDKNEITEKNHDVLSRDLFFAIILVIIISGLGGYFYSKTISKPVLILQDGARKISSGNWGYKVEIKSKDEFEQLGHAFNLMSEKITESYGILEKKVNERTKELKNSLFEMQNSRMAAMNILEDVEEEKLKSENLAAIVRDTQQAIIREDLNGIAESWNIGAENLYGFKANEITGKSLNVIVPEDKLLEWKNILQKTSQGKSIKNLKTKRKKKDGTLIDVSMTVSPVRDQNGKVVGVSKVIQDITREMQVDRAKTEFVSLASHQLRTPLSSINWYSEMLLSGDAGKISKEQEDFIKEIYTGNQRMVELVNSLLNVSRIELGTLAIDPKPIDFREVSKNIVKELKNEINKKGLKVNEDYENNLPNINADLNLVRIIFQNIITNSVKYTPNNGKISISIKKENKDVLIKISDSGYGIPKDQHYKIFQKLFRADNVREKDTNGSGLGLYLVKSIVDETKGKIWFKSEENKGATFYIKMPLSGMKKKEGSRTLD